MRWKRRAADMGRILQVNVIHTFAAFKKNGNLTVEMLKINRFSA